MRHLIPLLALLVVMMSGCRAIVGCQGPTDVGEGGQSIPPLRVPVGLAEPNKKEALKVPELIEPEPPRKPGSCLDEPPSYFPDRRVGAEGPKETEPNKPAAAPEVKPEAPEAKPETKPEGTETQAEKPDER